MDQAFHAVVTQTAGGGGTVLFDTLAASKVSAAGTTATFTTSDGDWSIGVGATHLDVGSGANGTTNRALVVAIIFGDQASGTVSSPSVTWNGASLTAIGGPYTHTSNGDMWLFGMVAPDTGGHSLVVSWTGTATVIAAALSVVGALQTGGSATFHGVTSATGSGTSSSITPAALSNEISFASYLIATAYSSFSHTEIYRYNTGSVSASAAQYGSGASPALVATTTAGNWVAAGVAIAGA